MSCPRPLMQECEMSHSCVGRTLAGGVVPACWLQKCDALVAGGTFYITVGHVLHVNAVRRAQFTHFEDDLSRAICEHVLDVYFAATKAVEAEEKSFTPQN